MGPPSLPPSVAAGHGRFPLADASRPPALTDGAVAFENIPIHSLDAMSEPPMANSVRSTCSGDACSDVTTSRVSEEARACIVVSRACSSGVITPCANLASMRARGGIGANVSSVPTRDSEDSRPYDRSSEVSASRFTIRHCDGRMRSHDSCKGEGASGGATGVEDEAGSGESMLVDSA